MNECYEVCNHDCEYCNYFDDCYVPNNSKDYSHLLEENGLEDTFINDMVEEEVWNKDYVCFEKKYVFHDKRKYWKTSYKQNRRAEG